MRRIGDGEVAETAEMLSKSASQLKKSLDADLKKSMTIDKAARAEIIQEADDWVKEAKALKSRVKDGKPSSGEAQQPRRVRAGSSHSSRRTSFRPPPVRGPGSTASCRPSRAPHNKSWGTAQ